MKKFISGRVKNGIFNSNIHENFNISNVTNNNLLLPIVFTFNILT